MILFRPVGVRELELIADSGWKAFPPRLPIQPIFYPVLNQTYAEQIARGWNTKDAASGYAGFVTRFEVDDAVAKKYDVQIVGAKIHQELWVPAEELPAFNAAIIGKIEVVIGFSGPEFTGELDPETWLPEHLRTNGHR
jgi:hypothetical protein